MFQRRDTVKVIPLSMLQTFFLGLNKLTLARDRALR